MSRNTAISTLVRWREFEEARASDEFRRCAVHTRSVAERVEGALGAIERVQQHRTALLDAPQVDLAWFQMAAQIEEAAWHRLEAMQAEHAAAQQQQDTALGNHVGARTRTRVADARHQRMTAAEMEHAEKQTFDWMADLYSRNQRGQR